MDALQMCIQVLLPLHAGDARDLREHRRQVAAEQPRRGDDTQSPAALRPAPARAPCADAVPCRYAQLRELGGSATSVLAWRAGRWETLSSEALVPGDLIALSRSPPGFVDGVDSICPARHLTRDPTDACRIGASWLRGPAVTG